MVNVTDVFKLAYENALNDNNIINIEYINKKLSEVKSIVEGLGMILGYSKNCDEIAFNYIKEVYMAWSAKLSPDIIKMLKEYDIDSLNDVKEEQKQKLAPIITLSKEKINNILTVTSSSEKYKLDNLSFNSAKLKSLKEESIIASCPKDIYNKIVSRKEIFRKVQKDNSMSLTNKMIRFNNEETRVKAL